MNAPIQLTSLEQWNELEPLSKINTVDRNNRNRILNAYRSYVRNRYVCPTCPSAVWQALTDVKAFIEQHRGRMEEMQAERDINQYKQDGKEDLS